jgi:hypothetical protein
MLMLRFLRLTGKSYKDVAADAFVLRGAEVATPAGDTVACQVNDQWQINDERFLHFECEESLACLFESDGQTRERCGPFQGVTIARGVMWSGASSIAVLQKDGWHSLHSSQIWPRVRLVGL